VVRGREVFQLACNQWEEIIERRVPVGQAEVTTGNDINARLNCPACLKIPGQNRKITHSNAGNEGIKDNFGGYQIDLRMSRQKI